MGGSFGPKRMSVGEIEKALARQHYYMRETSSGKLTAAVVTVAPLFEVCWIRGVISPDANLL